MYQAEMFSNSMARTGVYLGGGCFSRAHRVSNGKVCKVGRNDGTRNWLEFCLSMQEAGKLMPLMPIVHKVVPCDVDAYMAVMDEYMPYYDAAEKGLLPVLGTYSVEATVVNTPVYLRVRQAFVEYMHKLGGWIEFNDMHRQNFMYCEERGLIITDPSSVGYVPANVPEELILQ